VFRWFQSRERSMRMSKFVVQIVDQWGVGCFNPANGLWNVKGRRAMKYLNCQKRFNPANGLWNVKEHIFPEVWENYTPVLSSPQGGLFLVGRDTGDGGEGIFENRGSFLCQILSAQRMEEKKSLIFKENRRRKPSQILFLPPPQN
jgi:hypothetical protein